MIRAERVFSGSPGIRRYPIRRLLAFGRPARQPSGVWPSVGGTGRLAPVAGLLSPPSSSRPRILPRVEGDPWPSATIRSWVRQSRRTRASRLPAVRVERLQAVRPDGLFRYSSNTKRTRATPRGDDSQPEVDRRSNPMLIIDGRSPCRPKRSDGVDDETRTRDILDHNQVLYQLSYTHHRVT